MSIMSVSKISHASYVTPDLDRLSEYYQQVLGLTLVEKDDHRVYLGGTVDHHSVMLRQGTAALCEGLGFQLGSEADLDQFEQQVKAHGLDTRRERDPEPGIADQFTFLDPKGTRIQIFRAQTPSSRRFATQGIVPNKLGHVAFHVEDVVAMTDFYCNVLGFRVSDWLERQFSFLRCGPDHHTVNFIGSGEVRHDHTAFELRDLSHMQAACDYLSRNNIRLIWGPGRHGIGHNLFIYHRNPDGMIVELYAELDRMSEETLGYFEPRPWHPDSPQRPKTWQMSPRLVNLWREEFPPEEMLKV